MSGSTMIGDIPPDYPELKSKMIEIKRDATHDNIIETIKKSFENEYIEIEKESRRYGLELYKNQGFEVGYNDLNTIVS